MPNEQSGARFFDDQKRERGWAVKVVRRERAPGALVILDVTTTDVDLKSFLGSLDRSPLRVQQTGDEGTNHTFAWASGTKRPDDARPGNPASSSPRNRKRIRPVFCGRARLGAQSSDYGAIIRSVEATRIPPQSAGRALSAEVRVSLAAVRVAQVDARLRARRQTVRTRIWFVTSLAAVGLAAFAVGSWLFRGRHARPRASLLTPVTTAMTTPLLAEPVRRT